MLQMAVTSEVDIWYMSYWSHSNVCWRQDIWQQVLAVCVAINGSLHKQVSVV